MQKVRSGILVLLMLGIQLVASDWARAVPGTTIIVDHLDGIAQGRGDSGLRQGTTRRAKDVSPPVRPKWVYG